jgi:hypothetical protein
MKKVLTVVLFQFFVGGLAGWSATAPIYINNSPVQSPPDIAPQIDATAFVNRSVFSIGTFSLEPLPYETLNTLFFTNTGSGVMTGDPGFRFNYAAGNSRLPMDTWVNQGSISVDSSTFFGSSISLLGLSANWLLVSATNITSTGPLSVGSQGLLRLEGKKINLTRNGLRSGQSLTNSGIFFGSGVLSSNYFNDFGITDVYWGAGTNNHLDNKGMLMNLTGAGGLDDLVYDLPFPRTPYHQVIEGFSGFTFTNTLSLPLFNSFYDAAVYTNRLGPTNFSIQVVFFPASNFDPDLNTSVRFYPGGNGATVVVGFNSTDFDIVSQTQFTNSLFLVDALAYQTNVFLARNTGGNTRRPDTYEVTRNEPFFFSGFGSTPGNAVYTNTMIYNPSYLSNQVQVLYAGYQANVSPLNTASTTVPGSPLADPTNYPGRIELLADEMNLDRTRIRADSTLIVRTSNLTSNRFAQVDAPFMIFDVGSTQPSLLISNLAPTSVKRLSGTISAWSAIWRNYQTNATATNAIDFHVLLVDSSIQSFYPVVMNEFGVKGSNVVMVDNISVGQKLKLNLDGLDLVGSLTLPYGSSWGATNVLNLNNFTNRGTLSLTGSGFFGADRPSPYANFVNSGTVSASSEFVRAQNVENRGILSAGGGLLSIDALRARFLGAPTLLFTNIFTNIFFGFTNVVTNIVTNSIGATLAGNSDVQINADDLVVSNSLFQAGISSPGNLIFNVTNRLVDSGPNGINEWTATAGFNMQRKPVESSLLYTHLRSRAAQFEENFHFWPADDLGARPEGYENNLALGKLILNAQGNLSLFHFAGTGPGRALYADFIELENYATNFNEFIQVEPSLTIYFADANVPVNKLNGAAGGRFVWVPTFAGPNSSTNLVYPSGDVVTLNHALVTNTDLDSDGDGIVNSEDPTPVFVGAQVDLTVALTNAPSRKVLLSWYTTGNATNRVQFKDSLDAATLWQVLTTIVSGPLSGRLNAEDVVPSSAGQRYYRIQIDPQ